MSRPDPSPTLSCHPSTPRPAFRDPLQVRISRPGPVWGLNWVPDPVAGGELVLVAVDWAQTVARFTVHGRPVGQEAELTFAPNSVAALGGGEVVVLGGADGHVHFATPDGRVVAGWNPGGEGTSTRVDATSATRGSGGARTPTPGDWVWHAALWHPHAGGTPTSGDGSSAYGGGGGGAFDAYTSRGAPARFLIAAGRECGHVSVHEVNLDLTPVHSGSRVARRGSFTSVVIHDHAVGSRLVILCSSVVRNLALHRRRLAVLLHDRIVVYELAETTHDRDGAGVTTTSGTSIMASSSGGAQTSVGPPFRRLAQIPRGLDTETDVIAVTASHVYAGAGSKLECLAMDPPGQYVRTWQFDAPVSHVRSIGARPAVDSVLVGLTSGAVLQVFANNPFPVDVVTAAAGGSTGAGGPGHTGSTSSSSNHAGGGGGGRSPAVKGLDLSPDLSQLLVREASGRVTLHHLTQKTPGRVVVDGGATGAVFARDVEEHGSVVGVSVGRALHLYAGRTLVGPVPCPGPLLGSWGARAICLADESPESPSGAEALGGGAGGRTSTSAGPTSSRAPGGGGSATASGAGGGGGMSGECVPVDIPLEALAHAFARESEWEHAYQVTCSGASSSGWRALADSALLSMEFGLARKCYQRLRDVRMLEAVAYAERLRASREKPLRIKAECLASLGRFPAAAEAFMGAGDMPKAVAMFADLRMFDEALAFLTAQGDAGPAATELMLKQAEWCSASKDFKGAARMYVGAGRPERAVALLIRQQWWKELDRLVPKLDKDKHRELLQQVARNFNKHGQHAFARDVMMRLGDTRGLALAYAEMGKWRDAFQVSVV